VIRELYRFDERDPHRATYEKWFGPNSPERLDAVEDLVAHLASKRLFLSKVVAHAPAGHPESSLASARAALGGELDVTISHPEYLEFTAPGVNKGSGVRWLSRRLGIPLAQTMAIGDQYNDLEMIQAVGHGVAMAGAPEAVQAAARYVAPPVDEDGAARMIERLILGSGGE
jgi:hydroxymethylpyrimidine pyrophosphatase-like HAD family hydrolase